MKKELFNKLLNESEFLSLFYQARQQSEQTKTPLEANFICIGLNKYKTWFFKLCEYWGLDTLTQIIEFNEKVKSI